MKGSSADDLDIIRKENIVYFSVSILDTAALKDLGENFDYIIHAAATLGIDKVDVALKKTIESFKRKFSKNEN